MKQFVGACVLLTLMLLAADIGGQTPKREDVPKYLKMLRAAAAKDRVTAAEMLGKRGAINVKDVADAIDPLKAALEKDTDYGVRRAAAEALGKIAPDAETTVPLLTDALKVKDYALRMAAVQALAAYGPQAKDALPALRELRKELNNKKDDKMIGAAMQAINATKKK